jgi:uncharacterized CHY-type Zn-finger protein
MVKGKIIDKHTRCIHYHSELDIIAIKMKCCNEYYACFFCHDESADHQPEVWKKTEFENKAILCGNCNMELTIHQYFNYGYQCPNCGSNFNPKCKNHNHLYFES